jgi:putative ABC transport system permease protein
MIKNYLKIAWRNLWRHWRMTMINVSGLGIGMAATVLIVLWVQNELSFDKFQPDAKNIFRIKVRLAISKKETWVWETSQYVLGDFASKQIPEITDVTRLKGNYGDINMRYGDEIITEKKSAYVDGHWFKMFHYDFVDGSADAFSKNPFSLIVTQSAAKKYFGTHPAVGKVLRIDSNNYQVQAVIKDNPANSSFQYELLIPIAAQLADAREKKQALQWGNYNYLTFLKLKPGSNSALVARKLKSIVHKNKKGDKDDQKFELTSLRDIHFENDLQSSSMIHGNLTIVNVFIVLGGLLLITACINYVNLTTARASLRSKEVSIRKIVGANRAHLFGQFMSESLLVSFLALALALILVQAVMPWFRNFTGKAVEDPFTSPSILLILGSTLFVSFLLNGLYPAAVLSSFQPLNVFRGKSFLNFKDASLRRVLVVSQFTISVVLIAGTLVIYGQLQYIQKTDPGYSRSQILSFSFPYWKIPHFDFKNSDAVLNTVKQQLREQSVTSNVAMAASGLVNFKSASSGGFDWAGRPKDFNPSFAPLQADVDFQKLMHIKIKEGRWFNNDVSDKKSVLLNETAVQLTGLREPILGQRFIHQGDTGVIVGVVTDFHYKSLHDKIGPMVISNRPGEGFYIKTSPGNTAAAIVVAGKIWKQYFPNAPFVYNFLDETYNNLYKEEQQSSILITLFAGIAIFISALGLLGLAAFASEQKVKEIGIRKVLGASMQHIVRLLYVDFVKMVCVACVIALPLAYWAMNKWLQGFAYRITLSWWIFFDAAAIALAIALITVSFQAIKAAIANPVKSLRSE